MVYADVDCVPPGDFCYFKLGPLARNRGRLLFFTWEQVENTALACEPMFQATLSQRDLLRLAKAALRIAGNELHRRIEIPENTWGKREETNES